MRRGEGGGRRYREERRREVVGDLMRGKVRSAGREQEVARRQYEACNTYLRRRWGHHRALMAQYGAIVQEEVRALWNRLRQNDPTLTLHI